MKNKVLFKEFCEKHADNMSFSLHYTWWNEVVKTDWDVAILNNGDETYAVMPYYIRKKGPWLLLSNAHFTPYTGPFLIYPKGQKAANKIAFEHKAYKALIDQLPDFSEYVQNFNLNFNNGLPFQWEGFSETNRYTYILPLNNTEEYLFENLRSNNRRQIKSAEKTLKVSESSNAQLLQTLLSESVNNSIEACYFIRMVDYLKQHNCGKLLVASENDIPHAAVFCIWDKHSAYSIICGSAKAHKNSGAMSLLLWEAIKYCNKISLTSFNFEGSSIASIEKYYRGFGGELVSFKRIEKNNSTSLAVAKKIKG